jgi:hypothetical protein
MWGFLNRNAGGIQALAALLTVLLALGALIGVKMQIDAADRIQRAQSARDIYREYLSMAINKPEFAQPDYCAISKTPQAPAYEHFVEYMLYTAEQSISVDPDWADTFEAVFKVHAQYLCTLNDTSGYNDAVGRLIETFKVQECQSSQPCN